MNQRGCNQASMILALLLAPSAHLANGQTLPSSFLLASCGTVGNRDWGLGIQDVQSGPGESAARLRSRRRVGFDPARKECARLGRSPFRGSLCRWRNGLAAGGGEVRTQHQRRCCSIR